jgi:hypothetical protein
MFTIMGKAGNTGSGHKVSQKFPYLPYAGNTGRFRLHAAVTGPAKL